MSCAGRSVGSIAFALFVAKLEATPPIQEIEITVEVLGQRDFCAGSVGAVRAGRKERPIVSIVVVDARRLGRAAGQHREQSREGVRGHRRECVRVGDAAMCEAREIGARPRFEAAGEVNRVEAIDADQQHMMHIVVSLVPLRLRRLAGRIGQRTGCYGNTCEEREPRSRSLSFGHRTSPSAMDERRATVGARDDVSVTAVVRNLNTEKFLRKRRLIGVHTASKKIAWERRATDNTRNVPAEENLTMQAWLIFALGSAFFAGLTAVLGKVGVEGLNSNFATLLRTGVILVFSSVLVTARGEWALPSGTSARSWLFLVLSGLATGASWLCYYRALQLTAASRVAPIDKLSVVVVLVLGVTLLGESLSWKLLLGGALITAGAALIASI